MLDGIRYTGILGNALIIEIDLAVCIYGNVLKESILLDSAIDIRLILLGEADNLSIASALKVEYAVVIPAVLVITDEESLGIG